jgi:hypothetical protein
MRQQEYQKSWPGCAPRITKRAGIWQSQIYLFPFVIPSLLSSVFAPCFFSHLFLLSIFQMNFPIFSIFHFPLSFCPRFCSTLFPLLVPLCVPLSFYSICSPSIFPYRFPYLFPLFFSLSASCICSPFISLVFLPILLLYFPYIDPFSLLFFPYLFLCMS